MKKVIIILSIFVAFTFAVEDNNKSNSELFHLVQKFIVLNNELKDLNDKSDNNASIFSDQKTSIKKQKQELLNTLPKVISAQSIDEAYIKRFLEHKNKLEQEFQKLTTQNVKFAQSKIELSSLELDESFYKSLFELESLFKKTASAKELSTLLQNAQSKLQVLVEFDLSELKTRLDFKELSTINEAENKLLLKADSYDEILNYLKDNASLLESNFIFARLELQVLIDKINEFAGFDFLNTGKIVISFFILALFYVLNLFLPRLSYFMLVNSFFKHDTDAMSREEIRSIFIEKNKKPFKLLLFFYALSVCFSIAYYPAPVLITITNVFYIIYAVLFAWLVIRILDSYGVILLSTLAKKSEKKEIVNLIIKILYFVVVVIAILFVLAHLGFNVSAIIASLGIGGLAVALAAKDVIANFFASLMVSFDDGLNQGDWVEVAGVEGTVVEIGLRKTAIRTFDNALVYVPNSTIMNANIKNWSKRRIGRHIKMILGVAYDAKAEQLEQCVKDLKAYLDKSELVAHSEDSALNTNSYKAIYRQNLVSINDLEGYKNACYVSLCEFADSSINIELYFYTKAINSEDFREARQVLMLDFMRILEKNGLGFAFPSLSIYVENLKDLKNLDLKNAKA
ncbi:mechanosensitive ion channel domain-containing protein [Campylobacter sp. MIT 97-5078]|uniref:mechanosensitive ion channel domain-containing protein n=1 Tax=Campylobacter sp. MIT 97-5078 TaxID=1548153 RepID=UPI0005135923|nr:mechanosensitive ion channel family protein [Campylobacter sp. MIT 97-5078]KGI55936.1 mechanosensitive ion channel protein [Campylobacter sp. MIT 97-5078]TQR27805.1 mechanosensitive ion channel protein [Campylobacter sp. MIT 97-5078]